MILIFDHTLPFSFIKNKGNEYNEGRNKVISVEKILPYSFLRKIIVKQKNYFIVSEWEY